MSPIYETAEDQLAEQEIANAVVTATKLLEAGKLPLAYCLDRAAIREHGKVTAFFEIKDRRMAFGEADDGVYLSLFKVLNARQLTEATGINCRLVVRFDGGDIHWCPLDAYDRDVGVFWFGRNGRPPEPCVTYAWAVFKRLV